VKINFIDNQNINKYIILGLSLYIIFFILTSIKNILSFKYEFILLALLLSFLNYIVRLFRWRYYLSNLGIKSKLNNVIFFSGLSMTITPGKFGELFKAYLLKRSDRVPIGKTSAIVFVERVTDVFGMFVLCLIGSFSVLYKFWFLFIIIAVILILITIINNDIVYKKIKSVVFRFKFLKRIEKLVEEFRYGIKILFSKKSMIYTLTLTTIGWLFEGIGLWIILLGFGINVDITTIIFIYAFSSLIGSISFIPGGIAVTEGSMVILLSNIGLPMQIALSSTILIRLVTLWFGVIVGIIALTIYEKKIKDYKP